VARAALMLVIGGAAVSAWAWYVSHALLTATSEDEERARLHRGVSVSVGVHVAILLLGVLAFAATGDNWLVLAVIWAVGLPYPVLVAVALRRARRTPDQAESPR
jgi:hypothetical protein